VPIEAWADADDVNTYTGVSDVSDGEILRAQALVELFAGTTYDTPEDNISSRNRRYLRMAVAYQTVWMQERPDLFTHIDLDSYSQDGASGQYAHANANLLAPLAHRCINRLSWRNNPLRVRRGDGDTEYDDAGPRDSAVHDDSRVWTPL
jgi:hypothetical protein